MKNEPDKLLLLICYGILFFIGFLIIVGIINFIISA